MPAPQCTIRVHQDDQGVTFRVEGWAAMNHSLPFCHCAEKCLCGGAASLRVDLRQCTYMDSTFLGDLLLLKRDVERRGRGEFALVSPSPQCQRLLEQMRLNVFFPIVTAEQPPSWDWSDLPSGQAEVQAFQANVVEAHEELANLPGPAGDPFRAVVRCLNQARDTNTSC